MSSTVILILQIRPFSSVHSVVSNFVTPWTAAHHASLSITNSESLLKFMSIELVMPSSHLILCRPPSPPSFSLSHLQYFDHLIRRTESLEILTTPKPLTVWITTNCGKFFKRLGISDHLTCLLRNLYAGQEATV